MNKQDRCAGCYNNFYNNRLNCNGERNCWSLKDAKVVWRKKVHKNQVPPWRQKAIRVYNCRTERDYVFVSPDSIC